MLTKVACVLALLAFQSLEQVAACACCTNRGERTIRSTPLADYQRAIVDKLEFAPRAVLFVGEAGFEEIRGIDGSSERFSLVVTRRAREWSFEFAGEKGGRGTLDLAVPSAIDVFEVDPRDQPDQGSGPVLYKEWRLFSKFGGSGIFGRSPRQGSTLALILHGRGRGCADTADFHAWSLVGRGPNVAFTLLGEFARPAP